MAKQTTIVVIGSLRVSGASTVEHYAVPIQFYLTFTTLWANSAKDKLVISFLFFPGKGFDISLKMVSIRDNFHEMSKLVCWKK